MIHSLTTSPTGPKMSNVKSTKTGYDRTLLEWYGSAEKIPPYVKQTDYAADYLVDVVVLTNSTYFLRSIVIRI